MLFASYCLWLKALAADVLSLIATTVSNRTRDCLHYRLAGTDEPVSLWGHEYVRCVVLKGCLGWGRERSLFVWGGAAPKIQRLTLTQT